MSTDGRSDNQPQPPSLESLFTPRPGATPAWQNFAGFPRQRQLARQQAAAAAYERIAQEGDIDFARRDGLWTNADGTLVPLAQMTDARLYDLVCWCVTERFVLFRRYGRPEHRILSAELWLREQPLFLSLVLLAAQRKVTLPPTVFRYIDKTVLPFLERIRDGSNGEIDLDPPPPEHDPDLLAQQQDALDRLSQLRLKDNYGLNLRHLDI